MHNDIASNNLIEFSHVSKSFPPSTDVALNDVSFSVKAGEFVCFIGPSGCGKSTVLNIVAGLEKQTSGTVTLPGTVAMVFQSGALFPWLTVRENVAFGLRARGESGTPLKRAVEYYVELLKLTEHADRYPAELSGGQRQRVGIARALAVNPSVLLLDEPFSALDAKTTAELHDDLLKIWAYSRQTVVMVSHSIEEAVSLADRVVLMKEFRIDREFVITTKHPRRDNAEAFIHEVHAIRREFFK